MASWALGCSVARMVISVLPHGGAPCRGLVVVDSVRPSRRPGNRPPPASWRGGADVHPAVQVEDRLFVAESWRSRASRCGCRPIRSPGIRRAPGKTRASKRYPAIVPYDPGSAAGGPAGRLGNQEVVAQLGLALVVRFVLRLVVILVLLAFGVGCSFGHTHMSHVFAKNSSGIAECRNVAKHVVASSSSLRQFAGHYEATDCRRSMGHVLSTYSPKRSTQWHQRERTNDAIPRPYGWRTWPASLPRCGPQPVP